ncbi:MAG: NADH-quinone oxidoreductase subunit NuoK [Phycisphaerae bacterium]
MADIPVEHGLLVAAAIFAMGLIGVMVRRNIVFMLMCLEIMLNAAGLAFVVAGSHWAQPAVAVAGAPALAQADGQVMFFFILTMAAAEVSVGLALVLLFHHRFKTLDADAASEMKG